MQQLRDIDQHTITINDKSITLKGTPPQVNENKFETNQKHKKQ